MYNISYINEVPSPAPMMAKPKFRQNRLWSSHKTSSYKQKLVNKQNNNPTVYDNYNLNIQD